MLSRAVFSSSHMNFTLSLPSIQPCVLNTHGCPFPSRQHWHWKLFCEVLIYDYEKYLLVLLLKPKASGFQLKQKLLLKSSLMNVNPEPLINIWKKKKKKKKRNVLLVFINHAVFYCFFVVSQQKAVTKLVACIEGCPESEQNEKTAKELFHCIFASFSPKIILLLKRMQDSSCLAWKWEAPVFEWGVAARSTWYSHNNGKTTVWWSDGEAKEMDLSGGHSLTLGFFLHLRKKNLNAFSCPVVSILI